MTLRPLEPTTVNYNYNNYIIIIITDDNYNYPHKHNYHDHDRGETTAKRKLCSDRALLYQPVTGLPVRRSNR